MYYVAREAVDNDEYEPDFVLSDKGDDVFAGFESVETKHEVLDPAISSDTQKVHQIVMQRQASLRTCSISSLSSSLRLDILGT